MADARGKEASSEADGMGLRVEIRGKPAKPQPAKPISALEIAAALVIACVWMKRRMERECVAAAVLDEVRAA